MTLSDEARLFVERSQAATPKDRSTMTVQEARQFAKSMHRPSAVPSLDREERVAIPVGEAASVDGVYLSDRSAPKGLIVYIHGGGWVLNGVDEFLGVGRRLAKAADSGVLLVDHRKAPEHPFPTPLNDGVAALRWAAEYRSSLTGCDTDIPLVIAGDSSGANLAASIALSQRGAETPIPLAAQVLLYPALDPQMRSASHLDSANQLVFTSAVMSWYWRQYAGTTADLGDSRLAPALESDLSGLPPLIIVSAEHDVLRDEGEDYADRIRATGTPVHALRAMGTVHGFIGIESFESSGRAVEFVAHTLQSILR